MISNVYITTSHADYSATIEIHLDVNMSSPIFQYFINHAGAIQMNSDKRLNSLSRDLANVLNKDSVELIEWIKYLNAAKTDPAIQDLLDKIKLTYALKI